MTIVMYERVGFEGRRPSPFSWRIRYALTHKGVDVEYRPVRFADVDTIKQLSGQHFVPIIISLDGSTALHLGYVRWSPCSGRNSARSNFSVWVNNALGDFAPVTM